MTDIKMIDSITSDDNNIDGLNLGNLNLGNLNNVRNLNIDSDSLSEINGLTKNNVHSDLSSDNQLKLPSLNNKSQKSNENVTLQFMQKPPQPMQTSQQKQQPQPQPQQVKQKQQTQQPQQTQPQPQQRQVQPKPQIQPQLIEQKNEALPTKNVSFNDNVEHKSITPEEQNNKANCSEVLNIKKIKLGKLLVPQTTAFFTVVLIVISIGLFFATKPKKLEKENK